MVHRPASSDSPGEAEAFGEARLVEVLGGCREASAAETCACIVEAVRAHAGDAGPSDDLTLLVVRRLG